uniref:Uncharacterized protein n=1 Tax=Sphenodon punctatus TaxID=8508 RepID=A0A8D0GC24_SPHPU
MEEGGGNEEVIHLNSFHSHRGKDWINRRDEGLITISDSSDEELPIMLDIPLQEPRDNEDDDVVILMETSKQQLLRPNVIRPAAPWRGVNQTGEGGSKSKSAVRNGDIEKMAPASFVLHRTRQSCKTEGRAGPSMDENEVFELPGPSEFSGHGVDRGNKSEPGPSVAQTKARPHCEKDVINVEEVDSVINRVAQDQQDEDSEPEIVQNHGGAAAAAATAGGPCIQENSRLDHPYFQPAVNELHAVANRLAPQQGQPEAELGPLLRAFQEETPGPAFPRPEPQQDGIPGPASPQPAHPPEEARSQRAAINEEPGPAFPVQGSHEPGSSNVPEQEAAGLDKDLTVLLIKETEARFPDVKREYIEELIHAQNCCDLNMLGRIVKLPT